MTPREHSTSPFLAGLGFAEGLRWHRGELWFSDFLSRRVSSVDPRGVVTTHAFVPGQPSGLGFRPDGTPLVVSMYERMVFAVGPSSLEPVANLAHVFETGPCNDMIVDREGRAYVGGVERVGYGGLDGILPSRLALVDLDGSVRVVAADLDIPNGMALASGGGVLVVAETLGHRLTAFDVAKDGSLDNRRVFADLGTRGPDGICVDALGAVWVADYLHHEFIRVEEGRVTDVISTGDRLAVCCALGGADGRTLFCSIGDVSHNTIDPLQTAGTIETLRVPDPGP